MYVAYKFKICVVGDPTVGKTSLMLKYTEKKFNELYIPTVGVQVPIKQVPVKLRGIETLVDLNIWDIAGHVKFQKIRKIFYEGAQAILVLFDSTNQKSFDSGVNYWIGDIRNVANPYGILIGNKIDLEKERVISEDQGRSKAESFLVDYMETSAKTGEGVEDVFKLLTEKLLKQAGE
jgi:small GTP-binding protein